MWVPVQYGYVGSRTVRLSGFPYSMAKYKWVVRALLNTSLLIKLRKEPNKMCEMMETTRLSVVRRRLSGKAFDKVWFVGNCY